MEDNKIIDALLAEPETGLQLLLTQYGGLIHTVICRILPNNPQDAEECAADVLVAAWKHAAEFKQQNRLLRAWLCVTARNAAIDRWRALRPRQQECELNEELAQDWMTERRSTEAEELIAQLLTELPEPDREIFFRRYYYRESCREIGRRLNMQEHTVNVRLSRGREKLRKQFAVLRNTY